jgi:hypothetical protein
MRQGASSSPTHGTSAARGCWSISASWLSLRPARASRGRSAVPTTGCLAAKSSRTKLVDALAENAPKDDTLPLLAFALQRLWRQFAAKGALLRDHYDRIGGFKGLIEDAAERALRGLSPQEDVTLLPGPLPKRRDDLGAATFVPALAQINDQGAFIRRIAAWNGLSDEQQELLNRFDQWRLVVRKQGGGGGCCRATSRRT